MKIAKYIKLTRFTNLVAMASGAILCLTSFLTLSPLSLPSDSSKAAPGTPSESTLSLNVSRNTASVDLSVNSTSGTFAKSTSSTEASFNVATNNYTGYTLTINAPDDTGNLVSSNEDTLSSISTSITESSFDNSTNNGKWGYKPSYYNSSANTNFLPSPTTTASTLDATTTANTTPKSYTIALGARADYTTPAGIYAKVFTLTATSNPVNYVITYDANSTDSSIEDIPEAQAGSTTATSIKLSSTTPTRGQHNFLGWCTVTPVEVSNEDTCTGTGATTYQPGDDFGIDQTTANTTTLYAMWGAVTWEQAYQEAGKTKTDNYYSIQDATSEICEKVAIGQEIQVRDVRDSEIYLIGKLKDNRCWLLDNLRLDLTDQTIVNNTTSENTNASDETLYYLKHGGGDDGEDNRYLVYKARYGLDYEDSTYSNLNTPYLLSDGDCYNPQNCADDPTSGKWSKDSVVESYGNGSGKIGVYYNYCTASAGSYCFRNSGDQWDGEPAFPDPDPDSLLDVKEDICPTHWHLPTMGFSGFYIGFNSGEYYDLIEAYSWNQNGLNTNSVQNNLSVSLSGDFIKYNGVDNHGVLGAYWTSTIMGHEFNYEELSWLAPTLYVYSNKIETQKQTRDNGLSIRCILSKEITYELSFNKNTSDEVTNMPPSASSTAGDAGYTFVIPTSNIPSRTGYVFAGWSTSESGEPVYKYNNGEFSPSRINVPANNSSTTLYAIWYKPETITFTFDNHITSVDILNFNSELIDTIASSGGSLELTAPVEYIIRPVYSTGYMLDNVTITGGGSTPTLFPPMEAKFTVGYSSSTVNITSKAATLMQNYNCSNLQNVGDYDYVYDSRDNQSYKIGKLADGKCWMLENLNLTGGTTLTTSDTEMDVQDYTLPTSTVFTSSNTSGVYNSGRKQNCGNGQGIPCYSYYSSDYMSVCPKGWRLPTSSGGSEEWKSGSDFQNLAVAYGMSPGSLSENTVSFYRQAGPGTFPNFLKSGYYNNNYSSSTAFTDTIGYYFSSTVDYYYAFALQFSENSVSTNETDSYSTGVPIRCVAMPETTYSLSFDENTSDTVTDMPSTQSYIKQDDKGHSFSIPNQIPSRSGYDFVGWGTSSDSSEAEYIYDNGSFVPSSAQVYAHDNPKTLYAIWRHSESITFTFDSHISSIEIIDPNYNTTAGTISTSGDSVTLDAPFTYIIRPTYSTSYILSNITVTGTGGTPIPINPYDAEFQVGYGSATLNITSKHAPSMQNYDCDTITTIGHIDVVEDLRDNEIYTIGKLADGKCWLLDNLRLDPTNISLTDLKGNTNASDTTLEYFKNGGGTASDKYAISGASQWTSGTSYSDPLVNTGSIDVVPANSPVDSKGENRVGAYYNYCAASAGSYCYGNGQYDYGTPSGDAVEDICPAGWRLPTGGSSGEYQTLYGLYSNASPNQVSAFRDALSVPLSGYFYNGSASNQGGYGYYWSPTINTNNSIYNMDILYISSDYIHLATYSRSEGYSVRCVAASDTMHSLNFNKNTTDSVTNMPSTQTKTQQSDTWAEFDLSSLSIPSRSGYTFAGWDTSADQITPTYEYDGNSFTPNSIVVYTVDSPVTLYAIWHHSETIAFTYDSNISSIDIVQPDGTVIETISSSGSSVNLAAPVTYTIKPTYTAGYITDNMTVTGTGDTPIPINPRDATFEVGYGSATIDITSKLAPAIQNNNCSSITAVGHIDVVRDVRDNEIYTISKLADGKCWLLDNLRLDPTTVSLDNLKGNTNASDTTLGYLKNGGGTSSNRYPTSQVTRWTANNYSYSVPQVAIKNVSNDDWDPSTKSSGSNYGKGSNTIGVYYNYCAASAGYYCYGSGTSSGSPSGDSTEDICPAGWRLPTGGSSGEYQTLYGLYSNASPNQVSAFRDALSVPLSGYFYNGSASNQGNYGYYWSSSRYSTSNYYMSHLNISSTSATPHSSAYRYRGYSVRCVTIPENTYTLNFDQNTTDTVSDMPSTQSATETQAGDYSFTLSTTDIPSRSGYTFVGWGASSSQEEPSYRWDGSAYTPSTVSVSPFDSPTTLYAIWQNPETITFTFDNHISSIDILDFNRNVVNTVSSSGGSLSLATPVTYIIKPNYEMGYITDTMTTTGTGNNPTPTSLREATFTVGYGSATIGITSKILPLMQNYNCSAATLNEATYVYDNRDNEIYTISKLADGKCWLLDNLRLDPTEVSLATLKGNTNATDTTLEYLKNGGGTASDKYATSGVSEWTSGYSYSDPFIDTSSIYIIPDNAPDNSEGSNTVGVYYNYCAATAGSYCYGDNMDQGTQLGDVTEDICPAGWRLPTSGALDSDYVNLYDNYFNTKESYRTALSLPYSGRRASSSITRRDSEGTFFSANVSSISRVRTARVDDGSYNYVSTFDLDDRTSGDSVRCVAMPQTTYTIEFDENTTDSVSGMPSTQAKTLYNDTWAEFDLSPLSIPSRSGYIFAGWGISADQTTPTYKYSGNTFTPNLVVTYANNNPITLYAIWHHSETITFTYDSHISSVELIDYEGSTVGTVSTSGGSIALRAPLTYTIKPHFDTGYMTEDMVVTGTGDTPIPTSPREAEFTVGYGNATIHITSEYVPPMQNYDCSNISAIGHIAVVRDVRDEELYIIGKLADGKCWLLDNLRLDPTTVSLADLKGNTNASDASLEYLKNGGGTTSDKYATSGVSEWTSNYSYSDPLVNTRSIDVVPANSPVDSKGENRVGAYYNYCAASAGSYCYGNGQYDYGTPSDDAVEDICPAGWRLPTGGSSGEYKTLYGLYSNASPNQDSAFRNALSAPFSGYLYNGSTVQQGDSGFYWSSTRYSTQSMNYMYLSSSYISTESSINRYYGNSVRCVAMSETAYSLSFDENTEDTVTDMPSTQNETVRNDTTHTFAIPTNKIPSRQHYIFLGWGTSPDQATPTYAYSNGTFTPSSIALTKPNYSTTLYAVWAHNQEVTFTFDSNISSLVIKTYYHVTVGTISSSGESINLIDGSSYIIQPNYTSGYVNNSVTTTGSSSSITKILPREIRYTTDSNDAVTVNITSKVASAIQNYNCASLANTGDTDFVRDVRDDEYYVIGKLADGKCWLLDNLRLNPVTTSLANLKGNTNASDTTLDYLKGISTGTTSDRYPTAAVANWASSYSYSVPLVNASSAEEVPSNAPVNSKGSDKTGVYYNYCAASAGSYCFGNGTSYGTSSGNAVEDICPTGWRLPVGNTSGEYGTLYSTHYTTAATYRTALSLPLAGYMSSPSPVSKGSYGYFWTSSRYNNYRMYYTSISLTSVSQTYTNYYYGASVRCVNGTKPGVITYNANGGNVIGSMGEQSASNNASVTLYAPNFKRDGYGFAGWNTAPDGSGTFYGPNQDFTTPSNFSTTGLQLYAIWVQSAGNLQDSSTVTSVCNSLTQAPTDGTATLSSVSALTDTRDGNTYAIAKLADGKCWMIENLRLANKDSSNNDIILSSSNTNNPLLPLTNTDGTTSNHLSPTTDPYQTSWCTSSTSSCIDQSMIATNNTTLFTNNIPSGYSISGTNGNVYGYGNYYNWYSVTAGNGQYSSYNENVTGDICPNGWHLPTGKNSAGDFGLLDVALGGTGAESTSSTTPTATNMSNKYRAFPNNYVKSGRAISNEIQRGSFGEYWSSTAQTVYNAYIFYDSNSVRVGPGTNPESKERAATARCVMGNSGN